MTPRNNTGYFEMTMVDLRFAFVLACGSCFFMAGCSGEMVEPELAMVMGSVTVDGQPGANLLIQFEPQSMATGKGTSEVGGLSTATTDAGGAYTLTYKGQPVGAVVGQHLVRVTSAAGGGPAGGESAVAPTFIPPQFNTQSTLRKDVKAGDNVIDIEIVTK
jgi:hypothetical protein